MVLPYRQVLEASCLLPPDAWMKSQHNAKFTQKGEITLQFEEVKSQKDLALCFGNEVAFIPEEELKNKENRVNDDKVLGEEEE